MPTSPGRVSDFSGQRWIGKSVGGGRFFLEEQLGEGGMGAVFRASDRETGDVVAVKILLPSLAREAKSFERFRRETEVAGLIAHPHVVETLATGVEAEDTPWYAMELIEGETLSSFMRARGQLAVGPAVAIVRQIVSAISGAYEVGIVHRDLKPANVMVMVEDDLVRVKVVDFGLARFIDTRAYEKLTATGFVLGTPSYMAPEQAFGDDIDIRADIYAIGAILHALVTGEPPFGRGPTHEVLPRLMAYERTRLTETRRDLGPIVDVIERCLEPEPEHRYRTPEELDAALAPFDPTSGRAIEKWNRPKTLDTLALAPDPVLDAPRPRTRPILQVSPAVAAPAVTPGTGETAETPRGRLSAVSLAAVALAAIAGGAALTAALFSFASPTAEEQAAADVTGVSPVPVALDAETVADAAEAPTAQDASATAADAGTATAPRDSPDSENERTARSRQDERPPASVPAPGAVDESHEVGDAADILVEVRRSPVPPSRMRARVLDRAERIASCVARAVERTGVVYDGVVTQRPRGYAITYDYRPTLPAGVAHCIRVPPLRERPSGQSWSVEMHLRIAMTEGPGSIRFVDRTDWSSRSFTPPRLRVTLTIVSGDLTARQLQRTLRPNTAALARCFESGGPIPTPPPFEGTLTWHRLLTHNTNWSDTTPYQVHRCITGMAANDLEFPHVPREPLVTRIRAEAASRTSIRVVGP